MWFENAIGKEKIQFMFNNEFLLANLELIGFSFDYSKLSLSFNSRNIPKTYPKKWDKENFNSLLFSVTFSEIIDFRCNGKNVMFISSPKIEADKEQATIRIDHPNLFLFCKSKFFTIENIAPYIDDRWDSITCSKY